MKTNNSSTPIHQYPHTGLNRTLIGHTKPIKGPSKKHGQRPDIASYNKAPRGPLKSYPNALKFLMTAPEEMMRWWAGELLTEMYAQEFSLSSGDKHKTKPLRNAVLASVNSLIRFNRDCKG